MQIASQCRFQVNVDLVCRFQVDFKSKSCRFLVNKPPFYNVGVDYFGPFLIKQKRSLVKRYDCLVTCLRMRAVHIEILNFLTADSLINALRRFIARRGKPDHIYSDNGSNFVGANRILHKSLHELNHESLKVLLSASNKVDI